MKKAFCAFAVILCAFGVYRLAFRPVSVSLPDGCDSVSISTYGAVTGDMRLRTPASWGAG